MRAFAFLGLLTTAACGLDGAGLAFVYPDQEAHDAASAQDGTPPSQGMNDGAASEASLVDASVDTSSILPSDDGSAAQPRLDASDASDAIGADAALSSADGGDGGGTDVLLSSDGPSTCASAIPIGWSLAIYDLGGRGCPTNFTVHDALAQPVVGPGACSCACSVTQAGSCDQGTLSTFGDFGSGNLCSVAWFSVPISGSTCTQLPTTIGPIPARFQAVPLPGQGGMCAGTLVPDPTQVTASSARYCDVPAASAESVCLGTVPSGFAACIATSGETSCPSGSPFARRSVVEDAVTLACSACTGCSVTTTCSNARLTVHGGARCLDMGATFAVDGACAPTGFSGGQAKTAAAVEYSAAASSKCAAGVSTPNAQLTNPRTLCCL